MKTAHQTWLIVSVASAMLVLCAGPAGATTLYDQSLDVTQSAHFSNFGSAERADDFSLSTNATVTDVIWYGHYAGTDLATPLTTIDFAVSFFSDSSGLPGSLISQQSVAAAVEDSTMAVTVSPDIGSTIYKFSASITPVSVPAATTTWISISEDDASTDSVGSTQWLWNRSALTSASPAANRAGTGPWSASIANHAFTLDGIVPLPAAAWMGLAMLGGMAGVGAMSRKRRKA